MSDRPQGPGWWQASDLKWYPPEKHASHVAPPSTPTQPPVTKGLTGQTKRWFTLAGTALLLVTAALVAGRVLLGTFLPGLLLVAVIAIVAVTLAVRSGQSGARKAMLVSAMVLVVALAVPASLKVVYPAYHHFFKDRTSQASPPSQASPASTASPPSPASSPSQETPPSQAFPHSSASAKITVNGQNVPVNGSVHCGLDQTYTFTITAGHDISSAFVALDADPPTKVVSVRITDASGVEYGGDEVGIRRGDAQVAKSNETYKITGHIPLTSVGPSKAPVIGGGGVSDGPIEPFEIDVNCG
jgi:hypothetical protein